MADDDITDDRSNNTPMPDSGAAPNELLELDEVFAALGHPRRRYLLYALVAGGNEETLTELATKIVAWEQDKPLADVTDDERRRVHVSLYHSHVPKLADLGVLEYRESENIIVRALNTQQVRSVLNGAGAELDSRQEKHAQRRDPDSEQ